jgi:hypothetical protein
MKTFSTIIFVICLTFNAQAQEKSKTVRVLTIGNSFANNALTFLPEITEAAGHKLIVARANLGGCTLERHWKHVDVHEKDSDNKQGSPYSNGKYSLDDLLRRDQWDFITIQQASMRSHDLTTYYPYARNLCAYIRERAPNARIMVHQTWAYRLDDPRFTAKNEGKEPHTQPVMFEQVRKAYHSAAEELDLGILPSGDAMFLADSDPEWGYRPDTEFDFKNAEYPALPKQMHSLHTGWSWKRTDDEKRSLKIDGHHANLNGNYLLGCVWFETFFGESVAENSFVPEGIDPDYAQFLRQTGHRAVAELKATAEK